MHHPYAEIKTARHVQNAVMSVKQTYYTTSASLCAGLIDLAVVVPRPGERVGADKSILTK